MMKRWLRTFLPFALSLLCLTFTQSAQAFAGNGNSFFLSDDAAMTGGAVVATAKGGGSSWYNPAGLVSHTRTSIDISASAFVLRIRNTPGVIQTITPNQTYLNDLTSTELLPVPSALVFVKRLNSRFAISFGVFVPEQDVYIVQSRFELDEPMLEPALDIKSLQVLDLARQNSTYYAGSSIGFGLTETFRLGASLYAVYRKEAFDAEFFYSFLATDAQQNAVAKGFTDAKSKFSQTGIGVRARLGAQWEPLSWLHIGASVSSPLFLNWSTIDIQSAILQGVHGDPDGGDLEFENNQIRGGGLQISQVTPWEVALGLAITRTWGSLRVQLTHRPNFSIQEQNLNEQAVTNIQLGARIWTSPTFSMGAGFFTDRSAITEISPFGKPRVHYYGGTIGASWARRYAVSGSEQTDRIEFNTTVSFRYALGIGKTGGFAVEPFSETEEEPLMPILDVLFHEMSLHIGSGVHF